MSARLSVRAEQLSSYWKYIQEIRYLIIFKKSVEKNQFSLQSKNNNGYFT